MPSYLDYKLAVNWNNSAGLVKVGNLVSPGHAAYPFPEPVAKPNRTDGIRNQRLDLRIQVNGYASQRWDFGGLTFAQLDYLMTTFCGGGFSGLVTVRTRWRATAYGNYNVTLLIPDPNEWTKYGWGYTGAYVTLINPQAAA